MSIVYLMELNKDELNTIWCALRNVQNWHKEAIDRKVSVKSHEDLIKKEQDLIKQIEEFIQND